MSPIIGTFNDLEIGQIKQGLTDDVDGSYHDNVRFKVIRKATKEEYLQGLDNPNEDSIKIS